ncbi:MAG TPA: tetratricopeptide repeat protein, partial [Candidatus Acidoferrum sp.]|nr:tetratricopeptide repeat protein [Candidatus Acidoferrum sp.]
MRTQIVVLLWVILLAALPPSFSQSTPSRQQQIEAHNHQAAEYFHQNRPDLAVPEFRAIVGIDPNNVDAHGNLGVVLFFRGAYADAIPAVTCKRSHCSVPRESCVTSTSYSATV